MPVTVPLQKEVNTTGVASEPRGRAVLGGRGLSSGVPRALRPAWASLRSLRLCPHALHPLHNVSVCVRVSPPWEPLGPAPVLLRGVVSRPRRSRSKSPSAEVLAVTGDPEPSCLRVASFLGIPEWWLSLLVVLSFTTHALRCAGFVVEGKGKGMGHTALREHVTSARSVGPASHRQPGIRRCGRTGP